MKGHFNFEDLGIGELEAKKFIRLGLNGELKFKIINNINNRLQLLTEIELSEIYEKYPINVNLILEPSIYSHTIHEYGGFTKTKTVNYKDLWFDDNTKKLILKNFVKNSKQNNDILDNTLQQTDQSELENLLESSPYLQDIIKLTMNAIDKFPNWKEKQNKIQKTNNLLDWVQKTIGAETRRDADFIIKILSDIYPEIN